MISKLYRKFITRRQRAERRMQERQLERQCPTSPSSDDTYIVAFPKSGSTWFSYLVANVNLQINKIPVELTWWNLREYVFDVEENRYLPPNPFTLPHGRFIHTHASFNRRYNRVIYIVRDPRDVMVSYYDMGSKMGAFKGTMDEFIDSEGWGIPAWLRHVEGWVCKHTVLSYIQFIRYEDLKSNPVEVLDRIYRLYGLKVDRAILENAVERSSFKNMGASEAFYREKSQDQVTTFKFMRKGVAGGFDDGLTPAQIDLIEKRCADWMKVFNYLPTNKGT